MPNVRPQHAQDQCSNNLCRTRLWKLCKSSPSWLDAQCTPTACPRSMLEQLVQNEAVEIVQIKPFMAGCPMYAHSMPKINARTTCAERGCGNCANQALHGWMPNVRPHHAQDQCSNNLCRTRLWKLCTKHNRSGNADGSSNLTDPLSQVCHLVPQHQLCDAVVLCHRRPFVPR